MTELGKSLIDEGKKEKAIEIAKKAILKVWIMKLYKSLLIYL